MTDNGVIKISATATEQHGKAMYVFVTDSRTLFQFATVSRREENKERGYQRNLKESRARSIASYIDDQRGLIPNNIVINFENGTVFKEGMLWIPQKDDAAWVIDGQHRLYGMRLAKTSLTVSVLAFIGLSLEDQVSLFIKINREQRGVPSSLYLDLLVFIGDEDSLDRKVRDLIDQLNQEEDSPWFANIDMTGAGKGDISLANFARKLKPLVDPQRGVLQPYTFEEQYKIMANYFDGIKSVFLNQWSDKNKKLTKTLGFGALMNSFPGIFGLTRELYQGFTRNYVMKIFQLIKDFQFDSATLGSGTGNKAEMDAGTKILSLITDAVRNQEPEKGLIRLED